MWTERRPIAAEETEINRSDAEAWDGLSQWGKVQGKSSYNILKSVREDFDRNTEARLTLKIGYQRNNKKSFL